ncbi:MAG: hypothetical protein KDM64_14495 [Verrucomicrobiae bacterium]|nr:hypothetical protein [Verrucomicrobiae bacterium]
MNLRIIAATIVGVALGVGGTYMMMREPSAPRQNGKRGVDAKTERGLEGDPFAHPSEVEDDSVAVYDEEEWLRKLSGNWVSADGQQSAVLNYRRLRFDKTVDWPDISQRSFLLGEEMQFMTNRGFYVISTLYAEPDRMCFIKEDLQTGALTEFTLYREGSPNARSRKPLADKTPPPRVQKLLDAIPTIKAGETKDSVMARLGLADDDSLELLGGQRETGYTDMIFSLGIDNEWMLRLEFSVDSTDEEDGEAVIRHFQIVRGYVDDGRNGRFDIQKLVYPYFTDGQIIVAPPEAEPRHTSPDWLKSK